MTLYVWECKCCGTRYVEGFSRVSNPRIGMEFEIPCPYKCKVRPGITNESVMILKEIKKESEYMKEPTYTITVNGKPMYDIDSKEE